MSDIVWGLVGIFVAFANGVAASVKFFEELIQKLRQALWVVLGCDQFTELSPAVVINAQVLSSCHGDSLRQGHCQRARRGFHKGPTAKDSYRRV